MMTSWVRDVVAHGGWGDGFQLPLATKFQDPVCLRATSLMVVSVFQDKQWKCAEQQLNASVLAKNQE